MIPAKKRRKIHANGVEWEYAVTRRGGEPWEDGCSTMEHVIFAKNPVTKEEIRWSAKAGNDFWDGIRPAHVKELIEKRVLNGIRAR